jgi:uncharacterized membrane protein
MQVHDILGYMAGCCLLAMAASRTQAHMRAFNIAANALFIAYGLIGGLLPVLFLNIILISLHLYRLLQLARRDAAAGER